LGILQDSIVPKQKHPIATNLLRQVKIESNLIPTKLLARSLFCSIARRKAISRSELSVKLKHFNRKTTKISDRDHVILGFAIA
jgi:hypothetical protein